MQKVITVSELLLRTAERTWDSPKPQNSVFPDSVIETCLQVAIDHASDAETDGELTFTDNEERIKWIVKDAIRRLRFWK